MILFLINYTVLLFIELVIIIIIIITINDNNNRCVQLKKDCHVHLEWQEDE